MPYLSIVIPTYNREAFVGRALQSCLSQEYPDWEVLVVDDGSSDRSAEVAESFRDSRVRVLKHGKNRGVCPARNTGAQAATGAWVVFLDSDDELLPGALDTIRRYAESAPSGVSRLAFALRDVRGCVSPQPPLTAGKIWDYRGYLEWADQALERGDLLNCIRKDVFEVISWPDSKALEGIFHLEFARRFLTQCHNETLGVIHADASNRSHDATAAERVLHAHDQAAAAELIIQSHRTALQSRAPHFYRRCVREAAMFNFLAKKRAKGIKFSLELLRGQPFDITVWSLLMAGILGPRAILLLRDMRRRVVSSFLTNS